MSKKILFVVLGIVAVAGIGAALILSIELNKTSKEGVPKIEVPENAKKVVLTEEEVREIRLRATESQNVSLCEKLIKEQDRGYCRYVVINAEAGTKQDPDICNQLKDEQRIMVCKDNVILTKSLSSRDSSFCEGLTDKTRIEQCKQDVVSAEQ